MTSWPELESLLTDGISAQGRDVYLYTGVKGHDMLLHAIQIENAVGFVEWMQENKKIDLDTAETLTSMLRSEDKDNFNIALLAIEQLKK